MKPVLLLALSGTALCLSSCGLFQSAVQLPIRTLQSVGRGVGVGLEHSEEANQTGQATKESLPEFRQK